MSPYEHWWKAFSNEYDPFTPFGERSRKNYDPKTPKSTIMDLVKLALNAVPDIDNGDSAKVIVKRGNRTLEISIRDITPEPDENIEVISVQYEDSEEDDSDDSQD